MFLRVFHLIFGRFLCFYFVKISKNRDFYCTNCKVLTLRNLIRSNHLNYYAMKTDNYLTPLELMKAYPQVRRLGWSAIKIGIFFSAGMLEGYCCVRERRSMILESSFIELVDYVNVVNARKMIKIE